MSQFGGLTVTEFLDALASPAPTPGGGTASAVAGAMGASLLMMVAGLAKTRTGADEERVRLAEAAALLASVRERLLSLADTDAAAFDQVMAAYRLPKNSDAEKRTRTDAIQLALKAATAAPLETLRATGEAMSLARTVAQYGNRSAASDVGVAVSLLQAAADGAHANVSTNLGSLHDDAFGTSTTSDAEAIGERIAEDAAAARREVES